MTEETTICHNIDKTADDDNTGQAIDDPFLKNTRYTVKSDLAKLIWEYFRIEFGVVL